MFLAERLWAMGWRGATYVRRLMLMACSAAVALGLLLMVTSERSPGSLSVSDPTPRTARTRQGVVIFILDTSDYFDAHGAYVQSLDDSREAEVAVQVHQLYLTRRTLLPHHALHIGPMSIEVVRRIKNKNDHPLASPRSMRSGIRYREGARGAVRRDQKQEPESHCDCTCHEHQTSYVCYASPTHRP